MKLTSVFNNMEPIPVKHTGEGEDVNPELVIEDIPEKTKSLAIIVDDPDSTGKIWSHWVVWDILVESCVSRIFETEEHSPRQLTEYNVTNAETSCTIKLHENSKLGMVGTNDFKNIKYNGPMPPKGSGIHHYFFKVYALDNIPELRKGATKEELEKEMHGHVIERAELVGIYER